MIALAIVLASGVSTAAAGRYAAVGEAIKNGNREAAHARLDDMLRDDFIDAEGFYYYSMLEEKGELSVELLQKGLMLCDESCGSILSELADAYFVWGRYQDVADLYREYRKRIDRTPENMKFYWFAGMSFVRLGDYSSAEKAFKEIEREFDPTGLSGWGMLGRSSARACHGKVDDAISALTPLVSSGGGISALAIYNRAYLAAKAGDEDEALFGYNMLDQRLGEFIGSTELGELILARRSENPSGDAERLVDITYAVEMGVFGDKSEADRLAGKLRAANWTVDLADTTVGDRKYWVVRVGVFRSQQSAKETKSRLESLYPGSYRVVIR